MGCSVSRQKYCYSVPVHGSDREGQTPIFVHPNAKPYLSSSLFNNAKTLYQNFKTSAEKYGSRPFLGTRVYNRDGSLGEFRWKTYSEVLEFSVLIGSGLSSIGLRQPDAEGLSLLGIFSKSRAEWVTLDLACMSQGITTVPLYDKYSFEVLKYIINQTQLKAVACSFDLTEKLLKHKKDKHFGSLEVIIQFEAVDTQLRQKAKDLDIEIYSFSELAIKGTHCDEHPPTPDSIFTICYTSGTTGMPKGALLTHCNGVCALSGIVGSGFVFSSCDSMLSYLPLAHMLERLAVHFMILCGARIGFYTGDVHQIKDDLSVLQPTIFQTVPKVLNKIHDKLKCQVECSKGLNWLLYRCGYNKKRRMYEHGTYSPTPITDCVVFNKIRRVLGGRVRLIITGSTSIHPDVVKFLRIVLGVPIIEGYGLAETFAASFITQPGDYEVGHIGGPTPTVEAKLVDLPDIGYFSFDVNEKGEYTPRGELCLRGPTLFRGYYKDEDRTNQAMDSEGWIHTGDIAVRLYHNAAFRIIDRKHGVFKLSNGEFVATGKLELAYGKSKFIDQIFVYGDPSKSHLVAIIVPDEGYVKGAWAPRLGIEREKSLQELCQIEKLRDDILTDMEQISRDDNLPPYETIRKIYLENERWTENDILTSTHKLNRKAARDKYNNVLVRLYE